MPLFACIYLNAYDLCVCIFMFGPMQFQGFVSEDMKAAQFASQILIALETCKSRTPSAPLELHSPSASPGWRAGLTGG